MPQSDLMAELMNRFRIQSALAAMRLQPMNDQPMWVEDQMRGLRPGFTDGYDYWNALRYGVQRQGMMGGHMGSRVPQTGLLLKSENHPTFPLTVRGEEEAGYEIFRGVDGRLYSRPKQKRGRK